MHGERSSLVAEGAGTFASKLQSYIQFGEKFKAYPTCANHVYLPELINIIKHKCAVYKDIMNLNSGDMCTSSMKFVLGVKVFMYPEGVCACWLIVGQIAKEESL